jgi:hypothetical protein
MICEQSWASEETPSIGSMNSEPIPAARRLDNSPLEGELPVVTSVVCAT